MASSSTLTATRDNSSEYYDIDILSSTLIAQLALHDIDETTSSRKGKRRVDAPLTDEEYAFRIQHELLENALRTMEDYRIAKSFDAALETDFPYLSAMTVMEQAAADDRRAALALSNGQPLPELSRSQRSLEDPTFVVPSESAVNGTQPTAAGRSNTASSDSSVFPPPIMRRKDQSHDSSSGARDEKTQCISCGDSTRGAPSLRGPCNHDYCRSCITDLIDACTRDETLFPPRCCNQPFQYESLVPFLAPRLRSIYDIKRRELEVPANNRIYCPIPTCSTFLGSSAHTSANIVCTKCRISVCPLCRQTAHPGDNCSENTATIAVRELARTQNWQTCPECKAIIELHQGCYHMTCRCRAQFCYLCAVPWKNCQCPQWDEARLLNTAQLRVEQEFGGRARVAQPRVFIQEIQRMANTLRTHHDCDNHQWRRRNGEATCEECMDTLYQFILVCKFCSMRACVRCARNRLP